MAIPSCTEQVLVPLLVKQRGPHENAVVHAFRQDEIPKPSHTVNIVPMYLHKPPSVALQCLSMRVLGVRSPISANLGSNGCEEKDFAAC